MLNIFEILFALQCFSFVFVFNILTVQIVLTMKCCMEFVNSRWLGLLILWKSLIRTVICRKRQKYEDASFMILLWNTKIRYRLLHSNHHHPINMTTIVVFLNTLSTLLLISSWIYLNHIHSARLVFYLLSDDFRDAVTYVTCICNVFSHYLRPCPRLYIKQD